LAVGQGGSGHRIGERGHQFRRAMERGIGS